jgi:hypothetical protein
MSSSRTLSWSAALRDLRADRTTPQPVREVPLRYTGSPLPLSAWRGLSGRRYVVSVHSADATDLPAGVELPVARDAAGLAVLLADRVGITELHVHRLAETPADRAAVIADLLLDRTEIEDAVEGLVSVLDALDGDTNLEDGADAEPSLAAPENHHGSQIGWCRGSDGDREIAAPSRAPAALARAEIEAMKRLLTMLDAVDADPKANAVQALRKGAYQGSVLARVAVLLAQPEAWCRKASACDAAGNRVDATDPMAVAWDLGAAIDRASAGNVAAADAAEEVLLALAPHPMGLAGLNDDPTTTHADLVALLRA